jgi:iron-sulfur cluster repair protein YtfE (RIC family)
MDPTRMLEADHRMVEELFEKISKAKGEERQPLIEELKTSLEAHMALEEQVVYPAMEQVTGSETVQEGITEHELARTTLAEMVGLAPDKPGFEGALEAVKAGIVHHVNEEEGTVFPSLRRDGKQVLDGMSTDFMGKRLELGMPMDPAALAAAATKDELLAEAETAGVDGYSSMTKDELAGALVEQMSGSR